MAKQSCSLERAGKTGAERRDDKKGLCFDLNRLISNRRGFLQLLGMTALTPFVSAIEVGDPSPPSQKPKYYGVFSELPLGAIRPSGWTKEWLIRQAAGLSGHPENMGYPYDTCMLAGKIPPPSVKHGEGWWPYEQSGYFFDAVTRINRLIEDAGVKHLHQSALDYIVAKSTDLGYGACTWQWPNVVIGRALLAEYSTTHDQELGRLMEEVLLTHPIPSNREGVNAEVAFSLYGANGNPKLLAFAKDAYRECIGSNSFCAREKILGKLPLRTHGVSAAEALKIVALQYLYTGDNDALQLTTQAYGKVVEDSLMPDGGIVSSENLSTSAFDSLHESCDITDWSWSMGYCLMATGDTRWADIIERTIFNALPGALTKDFKQLQYFSGVNQVIATSLSNHKPFSSTRMSYRAAHDTECCAGNISRAMPNYISRQWMKTGTNGLAAILYGPSELTTTIGGQQITILQETEYPFRETIDFKIQSAHRVQFTMKFRIPGWCHSAQLQVNGKPINSQMSAGSFASVSRRFSDGDSIRLILPMKLEIEEWYKGQAVSLVRGPLVFSLAIDEKRVEILKDNPKLENQLKGNLIQGFPAVEFYPESEWRYGLDTSVLNDARGFRVVESPMTDNPFLAGQAPLHLEIRLRHLPDWNSSWVSVPKPLDSGDQPVIKTPRSLPSVAERERIGELSMKRMDLYGATHLRLTTLPKLREQHRV